LTLPRGTTAREYVSPSGQVFAVSWQGQAMPDLGQLLGSWADRASQGIADCNAAHSGGPAAPPRSVRPTS
jgi:hypothetical protein